MWGSHVKTSRQHVSESKQKKIQPLTTKSGDAKTGTAESTKPHDADKSKRRVRSGGGKFRDVEEVEEEEVGVDY